MALLQKAYLGATPLFRNTAWFEDDAWIQAQRFGSFTVTANTSAHTKGAWTQLTASTTSNASLLVLYILNVATTATNTASLVDIGFGASGSETAVIENMAVGASSSQGVYFAVPLQIPSGTRIAARMQSVVTGGKTCSVIPHIIDAGDYSSAPTSVDVISANTATSEGISFSGASGTWTEAIASTSRAYRGVVLLPSSHNADIATITNTVMSVGVGASGSEVEFGSQYHTYVSNEQSRIEAPFPMLFGRSIPAGSRLAVRHNIAADPSKYGFCLIGIP